MRCFRVLRGVLGFMRGLKKCWRKFEEDFNWFRSLVVYKVLKARNHLKIFGDFQRNLTKIFRIFN